MAFLKRILFVIQTFGLSVHSGLVVTSMIAGNTKQNISLQRPVVIEFHVTI